MTFAELKGLSLTIPSQQGAENYYKWIYSVIRPYIGKNVLELGPGHGNMVSLLIQDGGSYAGMDIDSGVVSFLKEKFSGRQDIFFESGPLTDDKWKRYFSSHAVDTVVSLNVLEHVENPDDLIKLLVNLIPGCRIVLFVPAIKWLYGSIDREAGHYRRFSKKDIITLFENNGIILEKIRYFNFFGAIGWFICNRILNQKVSSPLAGKLFRFYDIIVIPVIKQLDKLLTRIIGQSIIAVGKAGRKI